MLSRLIAWSIHFRLVVLVLAALVMADGIATLLAAPYDVFPEFTPPQAVIQTEAPGFTPEQVEQLVTRPIEQAIGGVGGLASLRSQSVEGLSIITAVFADNTDLYHLRQLVQERLGETAAQMPVGVKAPVLAPLTSSTSVVLTIGLTADHPDPVGLRRFADWTLRPALLGVPGVSKVAIYGGEVAQMQLQLLPERLQTYGLAVNDVLAAARLATGIRPAGFIETSNQRITLRSEGQSLSPQGLARVVVRHQRGQSVTIGDLANVVLAGAPRIGDASIGGQAGVILEISSQYGANTLAVTRRLESELSNLAPVFAAEHVTLHAGLFRPASFIDTALSNLRVSMLIGAVLVAIVLYWFLYNWRTALISLLAIPLALLVAALLLVHLGQSLNTMTLGGLAIALGEVVDDAIIDVENIFRRLQENRALPQPRPIFDVVLSASYEVRGAVIYATFVVAIIFLPVLAMGGVEGRLFAPLGQAYILAILASLAVALTLTPALAYWLLPREHSPEQEPRLIERLRAGYSRMLDRAFPHARPLAVASLVLCVAALACLPFLGLGFLPELREGHLILHMNGLPGTSLRETMRLGSRISKAIAELPQVEAVSQRGGRAEFADDPHGVHQSEFDVALKPLSAEGTDQLMADLRRILAAFPGPSFAINTFLTERIEETVSGNTAPVVIQIVGPDLDLLDTQAQAIAQVLARLPGTRNLQQSATPVVPEQVMRLKPAMLDRYGFAPLDVLDVLQTAYQGNTVGQVYEGNRVIDVTAILAAHDRSTPANTPALLLRSPDGVRLPLSTLADVYLAPGRYVVQHEDQHRVQTITCGFAGTNLAAYVSQARRAIATQVHLPRGYYVRFSGESEAAQAASNRLLFNAALALIGVVTLLYLAFGSASTLGLVLLELPFALVGGVIAVLVTGQSLTLGSLVGFVTLFGITARNALMLMAHYHHLVTVEGMAWGPEAAKRGAVERLRPILMTACVTGLGLLPIALGSGSAGREVEGPMAVVILGGLLTSTLLTLVLLPPLALRYGRFEPGAPEPPAAV